MTKNAKGLLLVAGITGFIIGLYIIIKKKKPPKDPYSVVIEYLDKNFPENKHTSSVTSYGKDYVTVWAEAIINNLDTFILNDKKYLTKIGKAVK